MARLSQPRADGRTAAGREVRGKSGLHEARVPGNARRGQPQGKRHREESAPVPRPYRGEAGVRVKRWGKSPPRTGQPGRHGKPHPEQCRIGASRGKVRVHSAMRCRRPPQGRLSPEARVGSLTPPATAVAEEWSSKGGNPRNRIRLTGHPRVFWYSAGGVPPHPGPLPEGRGRARRFFGCVSGAGGDGAAQRGGGHGAAIGVAHQVGEGGHRGIASGFSDIEVDLQATQIG